MMNPDEIRQWRDKERERLQDLVNLGHIAEVKRTIMILNTVLEED